MAFGKLGRPAEDALARQREIYEAVSPLILDIGVRRLSMRMAAQTACLSVGGLYHHVATKNALVLHGIQAEAITRYCQDFHEGYAYLVSSNPPAFFDAYLDFLTDAVGFVRPSVHAALELGINTLDNVLEPTLTAANEEFKKTFCNFFPRVGEDEVQQAGRAIHRAIVSALFDKSITKQEFRGEISALINGYRVMQQVRLNTSTISL